MIHQNNPLTHFFNLHSASSGDTYRSDATDDDEEIDVDDSVNNMTAKCPEEHTDTELDMVSGSVVGKSFTIAAILGLKAAAAAASNNAAAAASGGAFSKPNYTSTFTHSHLSGQRQFNDVMSLTLNPSLKQQQQQQPQSHHHHHPSAYDGLAINRLPNNSPFLANSFQHHSAGGGNALQNLQKLHQQHVAAAASGSLGHGGNGFRLMGSRSAEMKTKSSLKSKRVRTIFTPEQLERLEAEFERQQYMVGPERLYLAHTLQLTEAQVKVWFQNRRIKWRKHHLEMTQQRLAILRQRQIPGAVSNNNTAAPISSSSPVSNSEEVTALSADSRDSAGDI